MNFISLTFVFLFPIVLILYWKLPWKYRELFLLAVSYFFYIKESSWAGGLLLLTTVTTYLAGLAIEKGRHKKGWLIFYRSCMYRASDRIEIFSSTGRNLVLYVSDDGICDRCIPGRNCSRKKSTQLCPVYFFFSTAGCRPD